MQNTSRQKKHILVLNGPNLNLLGSREPNIYGHETLEDVEQLLQTQANALGVTLECKQSNREYELIEWVHAAAQKSQMIIINPGAFAHTSVALRDALLGVGIPFYEVHISNIYRREAFRHHSYLADIAEGVISGFGIYGYELALAAANRLIDSTLEK
ncbi:type II 3-dehydroquinate dehydratase [Idiomarina sp.]|uniref:type II 3-dehydroquinate dehydratase n=1 Tax=Idiomarina sp. TaxID=1874361 RepID=UPI0035119F25